MILKEVSKSDFIEEFKEYNRQDNFSAQGLCALYDYLESMYNEELAYILDVIDLCCTYTEYTSIEELKETYPDIESIDDLYCYTTVVIDEDDCIIIMDF